MDDSSLRIEPMSDPPGLRVAGEVDASNAHQLASKLEPAVGGGGDVHLDLAEVVFMDSTAISVLLGAARDLAPTGELVLIHPGTLVGNVLRLIRADHIPGLRIVPAPE